MERLNFNAKISEFKYVNPEMTEVKIDILYHGDNRNGSNLSKEVVEKKAQSLIGCPIVGCYIEELGDFDTHSYKTRPYGFIPESSKFSWEEKMVNGTIKEFFCATGYMWSKRYPELNRVSTLGNNHSMEISNVDGHEREDGVFVIDDFNFSALCILGADTNYQEPCFEKSIIKGISSDEFKEEFNLMYYTLNESIAGGVKNMENEKNLNNPIEDGEVNKPLEGEAVANTQTENPTEPEVKSGEEGEGVKTELNNGNVENNTEPKNEEPSEGEENITKADYDELVRQLKELQDKVESEKLESQKLEIIDKYSPVLSESEISEFKEKIKDFNLNQLEFDITKKIAENQLNSNSKSNSEFSLEEEKEGVRSALPKKDKSSKYCI